MANSDRTITGNVTPRTPHRLSLTGSLGAVYVVSPQPRLSISLPLTANIERMLVRQRRVSISKLLFFS